MQSGVDWSKAPDESDAETSRLARFAMAASESASMATEWRLQTGQTRSDAYGPVNSFDSTAQANVGGVTVYPSDEQGFFSGSSGNPIDEGSRITPAMKDSNARNRQSLYEKFQRDVQMGEALSFADDVANRKSAAASLRGWLAQENPAASSMNDMVADFGVEVGRSSPVLGGAIQIGRLFALGDGTNADLLLAAVGPLARVEGKIGLTVEERLAARVESAQAQRSAAKLAGFEATETVEVTGRTAANELSRSYQGAVASLYGQPARDVPYLASIDGKPTWLRADTVVQVGGRETAIEAKYVDDWVRSPRNPANDRPFPPDAPMDRTERATMLEQARQYSANFAGGAVYHTNSVELASYWSKAFLDAGLQNIRFIITPTVRR
jgi:hypothetical protein